MLIASYCRATDGQLSTLTLATFSWPGYFAAIRSTAGETMRHGPHHGAHRSTRTGTFACRTTLSNVPSVASVSHGNAALQEAHTGLPLAVAGTRFFVPQDGQDWMRASAGIPEKYQGYGRSMSSDGILTL